MFKQKEFEEKIRLQEEKVKKCELDCQVIFEMLGRQFFELPEVPHIPELETVLESARQKKAVMDTEVSVLQELNEAYLDEKKNSCSNCGIRIEIEGAKFCYNCGAPRHQETEEAVIEKPKTDKSKEAFCKGCLAKLKPGARFCRECGKQVESDA